MEYEKELVKRHYWKAEGEGAEDIHNTKDKKGFGEGRPSGRRVAALALAEESNASVTISPLPQSPCSVHVHSRQPQRQKAH